MTTRENLRNAIEPGSTEYGERQALEQGLGSVPTSGPPSPGANGAGVEPEGVLPPAGDPLEELLAGEAVSGEDPLTSGLSVGPGPGPESEAVLTDDLSVRLRTLATSAKSPQLRAMARAALRRRVKEGNLQ